MTGQNSCSLASNWNENDLPTRLYVPRASVITSVVTNCFVTSTVAMPSTPLWEREIFNSHVLSMRYLSDISFTSGPSIDDGEWGSFHVGKVIVVGDNGYQF